MNPHANEEVMWQRLKDMQRERENSQVFARRTLPVLLRAAALLGGRVRLLAAGTLRHAPQDGPPRVLDGEGEAADAAA